MAKLNLLSGLGGYCRFVWFEESDQFMSKSDVDQVLLSLYRGGDVFETLFTYNTPFSPSHWLNLGWHNEREMRTKVDERGREKERGEGEKVYFKHVNLYDVPRSIVPDQVYEMAEAMREDNVQEWKHVIMGETGDPATMVFPNVLSMRCEDMMRERDEREWLWQESHWRWLVGMDYGYRPDPTVSVVCGYNKVAKVLWLVDEASGVGLSEEGIYIAVTEMLKRGGAGAKKYFRTRYCEH